MITFHNSKLEAMAHMAELTSGMFATTATKEGKISQDEFCASGFKNASALEAFEPSIRISLIHTYTKDFKKVWRVNFGKL